MQEACGESSRSRRPRPRCSRRRGAVLEPLGARHALDTCAEPGPLMVNRAYESARARVVWSHYAGFSQPPTYLHP